MGLLNKLGVTLKGNTDVIKKISPDSGHKVETAGDDLQTLKRSLAPQWIDRHATISLQLYQTCEEHDWFELSNGSPNFAIRSGIYMSDYKTLPVHREDSSLLKIAQTVQFEAAVLVETSLTRAIMEDFPHDLEEVVLPGMKHIQVIDTMEDFQLLKRNQMSAFVRDIGAVLVWANHIDLLVPSVSYIEAKLLEMVDGASATQLDEKKAFTLITESAVSSTDDLEKASASEERDGQPLLSSISVGLVIIVLCYFIGQLVNGVLFSVMSGSSKLQFAIFLYIPVLIFLSSFFANVLVGCVLQVFGPSSHLTRNSKYYSAHKPRTSLQGQRLPHITVQCPVYKEDLAKVLRPTIMSVREAIGSYERQGGTANFFINDDGMQVISPSEAEFRKEFYRNMGIGWLARPGHSETFTRAGKFKKGSNMNFCMDISLRVETLLASMEKTEMWTDADEVEAQRKALETVLAEDGNIGIGEGDVRIGDIILLIDCDTRVPKDCFLDAATEFVESPEVAILQNSSGVMQVTHDFWENSLAYFTKNIYFSIQYACAAGDVAAFVGHNAYLRWSALQEVLYHENGKMKWWSEEHVSEDFIMSLKLQMKGYTTRMAVYHGEDYKEGVALTVYDELARWSKYAYGCSELVFQPLRYWFTKGPITPLFWTFLRSNMRPTSKFNIISYIGTYYSIACALWMTILNFFLNGWYAIYLQNDFQWYNDSFTIFISVTVVFLFVAPITNAALKYRVGLSSFWAAFFENIKYCLVFAVFLGGLSYHLSVGLAQHMLSIDVQWGATAKSLNDSDFFTEVPIIWRRFKYMYLFLLLIVAGQLTLAFIPAPAWRINELPAELSLGWIVCSHALMPLIFNPKSYLEEMHGEIASTTARIYRRFLNLFIKRQS